MYLLIRSTECSTQNAVKIEGYFLFPLTLGFYSVRISLLNESRDSVPVFKQHTLLSVWCSLKGCSPYLFVQGICSEHCSCSLS